MDKRLVVIGGGAAGFFCAVNAARMNPSLEVILLEKTNKVLSKVRVSGGGRCNVTHACDSIREMIKHYPRGEHFLKKAFAHFFAPQTIAWFDERGVALKTEADGRMFPVTDSSATIIDCLVREANQFGVQIRLNRDVKGITPALSEAPGVAPGEVPGQGSGFVLRLSDGVDMEASYVMVACGGLTKPEHFNWLQALGHEVQLPVPSLFTFNMPGNPITELMGVSVPEVQVKVAGTKLQERGPILITHWGCSGPVILRLSAWGAVELASRGYEFTLVVNWVPSLKQEELVGIFRDLRASQGGAFVVKKSLFNLPHRLWQYLAALSGISEQTRWGDLPAGAQNAFVRSLSTLELQVKGKTTFKEEFVTCGGIRLNQVDPGTMMSRILPGLFFGGEVLDVDGITGGFNFQHAWTSGYNAAKAISQLGLG
jgi:predicted Rossmann fold flavoprotein